MNSGWTSPRPVVADTQGKWITIQNDQNGNTYAAYIADECPTCPGYGDLDLSPSVFSGLNDGSVAIGCMAGDC